MAAILTQEEIDNILKDDPSNNTIPYKGTIQYNKMVMKNKLSSVLHPETVDDCLNNYDKLFEEHNKIFESFNNKLKKLWEEGVLNPNIYLTYMAEQLENTINTVLALELSFKTLSSMCDTNDIDTITENMINCKNIVKYAEELKKLLLKIIEKECD